MHESIRVHTMRAKCNLCRVTIDISFAHKFFTFSALSEKIDLLVQYIQESVQLSACEKRYIVLIL